MPTPTAEAGRIVWPPLTGTGSLGAWREDLQGQAAFPRPPRPCLLAKGSEPRPKAHVSKTSHCQIQGSPVKGGLAPKSPTLEA